MAYILLESCDDYADMPMEGDASTPTITSFCFKKELNPELEKDLIMEVKDDSLITGYFLGVKDLSLIASFEGEFLSVEVDGVNQVSGISRNDYNSKVIYELTSWGGQKNIIL